MSHLEVLTMGRVGVDLYPATSRTRLQDVELFHRFLGGTATNVAVAAARLGHRSAVLTKVGADPFGTFVRRALAGYGVVTDHVGEEPGIPTPITFCEIFPPDEFPLWFYRYPTAPDLQLRPEDLDLDAVREVDVLWTTGTGLCQEPSRSTTLRALERRAKAGITVLDLDYRPTFWGSPDEATTQVREAVRHVTVAVGNLEECRVAVGDAEPVTMAERLHELGVEIAVVKLGPEGVLGSGPHGVVRVPPLRVDVVNGLGAGDGFGGALCHGLLEGWGLEQTLRFANAAGALVAAQLACSEAMPTVDEVERAMKEATGD
jgi:5-dehydro-2-deoxygluconokinase